MPLSSPWKHLDKVHVRRPLWETGRKQVKAECQQRSTAGVSPPTPPLSLSSILLAQAVSPFRDSSLRNPRFHIWDYVGVCAC